MVCPSSGSSMEVLNLPLLEPLQAPHLSSRFLPNFTSSARLSRNSLRFRISSSKLNAAPSSAASWLSLSVSRDLRVSAHLGRRRRTRQNFLRKKLIEDPKVRLDYPDPHSASQGPIFSEPPKDVVSPQDESGIVADDNVEGPKPRVLGESVLWNKLENWVDQYKMDMELWGIGSGPIFTIIQDSDGNVRRVTVNEDEILKRSGIVSEDSEEVSLKILRAKSLAREMESGNNVIPRNSSVAKFIVSGKESGFIHTIRSLARRPDLSPKLSFAGRMALCGLIVIWAVKLFVSLGTREVKYTQLEKEMVRRKMKSRKEKEMLEKGRVEVVPKASEPSVVFNERPKLNREELMRSIRQSDSSKRILPYHLTISETDDAPEIHDKIEEIREMAGRARDIEARDPTQLEGSIGDDRDMEKEWNGKDAIELLPEGGSDLIKLRNESAVGDGPINGSEMVSLVGGFHRSTEENENIRTASDIDMEDHGITGHPEQNVKDGKAMPSATDSRKVYESLDPLDNKLNREGSPRRKPRIILSVKEAREYLSTVPEREESAQIPDQDGGTDTPIIKENERIFPDKKPLASSFGETYDPRTDPKYLDDVDAPGFESLPRKDDLVSSDEQGSINHVQTPSVDKINGSSMSAKPSEKTENWIEENFREIEPVLEKIGVGFKDNYLAAREKANRDLDVVSELEFVGNDDELDWMKDDNLREIVFQVRDNELAGRDPFYSMDVKDKRSFFEGLEKKVVRENEKLQNLHDYLHSNIENLDYGADGISLYDPPEKIVPRWKGPIMEKNPEVLTSFLEEREAFMNGEAKVPYPMKDVEKSSTEESKRALTSGTKSDSLVSINIRNSDSKDSRKGKITIEGSDGSVRAGKKSGKEFWQHTKKWSRGFLDSYNAETDPEVKSVMKDIGKDLDRWITDKEIEEAADLMNKLPERNKKFFEKKLDKIKREMELFGPQAVVSKYKEYAEDKEDDHLWWLDLPHVLCIELYTEQDGEQKVGFYSLEMATDLELEPKPYHVIAFEDPGDCKNLCYIIQAHMEMLGNGHAFVVARPPKDAFREAKANGFGVSVIRKGELQLNVDQTLEEVEEQITEIGSKIYHDAIMKDRSVDISTLMKGVFGFGGSKPRKRRSKRKLKKPSKKGR